MAMKYNVNLRNDRLNVVESTIGPLPKLRIYTGSPPANVADAATGTMLVEMVLPSDWMAPASGGTKSKAGTWSGVAAASGNAGYFRLYDNVGTTCHIQGTAGVSGDLALDSASFTTGQTATITASTITGSNA